MLRHPFAPLYIAAAGVVLLAAGAGIGAAIPNAPATPADMTMADCALWEHSNVPDLPANTYTDRCWDTTHNTIAYSDPAAH